MQEKVESQSPLSKRVFIYQASEARFMALYLCLNPLYPSGSSSTAHIEDLYVGEGLTGLNPLYPSGSSSTQKSQPICLKVYESGLNPLYPSESSSTYRYPDNIITVSMIRLNPLYPSGSSSTFRSPMKLRDKNKESQSPLSKRVFIYRWKVVLHACRRTDSLNPLYPSGSSSTRIPASSLNVRFAVSIPFIQAGLHLLPLWAIRICGCIMSQSPLSKRVFIYKELLYGCFG